MRKKNNIPEIRDDEIRVIGNDNSGNWSIKGWRVWVTSAAVLIVALCIAGFILLRNKPASEIAQEETSPEAPVKGLYEQEMMTDTAQQIQPAYVEVEERIVSEVPIRIFHPIGGTPSLSAGMPDFEDSSIIFITQAADIRADNMQILGDFVLGGVRMSEGKSKLGWCAIIGGKVYIGYDKEPWALQAAVTSGGYFFRQYGLIAGGRYVKESSRWKYSSLRRALCLKDGQCFIVETLEAETFPRFSHVLEDMGVEAAIYLVGGDSYGYARDMEGFKTEFGIYEPSVIFDNTSYLVWRK